MDALAIPVHEMIRDVTIIAGGWSVRNVNLTRLLGTVIAVNDSAIHAPNWDICISMDRVWAENRWPTVICRSLEVSPHRQIWLRRSAVQNFEERGVDLNTWPWVQVFECNHNSSKFAVIPNTLNGTNSGACALNLAWRLKPKRVFLLGFDMNRDARGRAYWYPPYPWSNGPGSTSKGKYDSWSEQFGSAERDFNSIDCEVLNVSPGSALRNFHKLTPQQYERLSR